jgi:hypothetical protein
MFPSQTKLKMQKIGEATRNEWDEECGAVGVPHLESALNRQWDCEQQPMP